MKKSPPYTHSVPLLCSLHCFSGHFRTVFKISLLTYETLREKRPVCLHSMLSLSLISFALRSNKRITLLVPGVKTNTGARAFHCCDCLLLKYGSFRETQDNQFNLKGHSVDSFLYRWLFVTTLILVMCISVLETLKEPDRVNPWSLVHQLIKRGVAVYTVHILNCC